MITSKQAIEIINKWKIDWTPKYREFICGGCSRKVRKAWHIHCKDGGYKRELHLCKNCGKGFNLK